MFHPAYGIYGSSASPTESFTRKTGKVSIMDMNNLGHLQSLLTLHEMGLFMTDSFLSTDVVRDFMRSNKRYDLVIGEAFFIEAVLAGFSRKFDCPLITLSTSTPGFFVNYMVSSRPRTKIREVAPRKTFPAVNFDPGFLFIPVYLYLKYLRSFIAKLVAMLIFPELMQKACISLRKSIFKIPKLETPFENAIPFFYFSIIPFFYFFLFYYKKKPFS